MKDNPQQYMPDYYPGQVQTTNAKPTGRLLILVRHSLPLFPITRIRSALQFPQKPHSLSVDSLGELGYILSTLMFV